MKKTANEIAKAERNRTNGMKYKLTKELKNHIKLMRNEINYLATDMADALGMIESTYNNIEKSTGSKAITVDVLNSIFKIYKEKIGWENMSNDKFIIMHLEKCLFVPNSMTGNIDRQGWLKAYYMKYQTVFLTESLKNQIFRAYGKGLNEVETWEAALTALNDNRHIKNKTRLTYAGEVYLDKSQDPGDDAQENSQEVGPDNMPYWGIRYEMTEDEIKTIAESITATREIRYSTLFAILATIRYDETFKKDYDEIYYDTYYTMAENKYKNIFEIIAEVKENHEKQEIETRYAEQDTPQSGEEFFAKLDEFKGGNVPPNVLQLIRNCTTGKDKFLDSINIDFSPLFSADSSVINKFRTELTDLINKITK